ncbi:MAG: SDR family oxidoreductase [Pseudomonadota bacterium]
MKALVTGASRRIGAAISQDLARHGWRLALHHYSSHEELAQLVAELPGGANTHHIVQANLSEADETKRLFADAWDALDGIDLIINNASVFEPDEADDLKMDLWDDHFAVHLRAPTLLSEALAQRHKPGEDRLIVNMIDQRVWALTPHFFSYTLSKSALWTATQTMAQAFAPRGLRVNAIGPGPTLPNPRQDQSDFDAQVQALPMGSGPLLDEFGATIRYLWEAKSVTGQMIALDGGQHLAWETPDVTSGRE